MNSLKSKPRSLLSWSPHGAVCRLFIKYLLEQHRGISEDGGMKKQGKNFPLFVSDIPVPLSRVGEGDPKSTG